MAPRSVECSRLTHELEIRPLRGSAIVTKAAQHALMAQRTAHPATNREVVGSIPSQGSVGSANGGEGSSLSVPGVVVAGESTAMTGAAQSRGWRDLDTPFHILATSVVSQGGLADLQTKCWNSVSDERIASVIAAHASGDWARPNQSESVP